MEGNWEVMSISANGTKESVNDENGARMPHSQGDQAGDFSLKMRLNKVLTLLLAHSAWLILKTNP